MCIDEGWCGCVFIYLYVNNIMLTEWFFYGLRVILCVCVVEGWVWV